MATEMLHAGVPLVIVSVASTTGGSQPTWTSTPTPSRAATPTPPPSGKSCRRQDERRESRDCLACTLTAVVRVGTPALRSHSDRPGHDVVGNGEDPLSHRPRPDSFRTARRACLVTVPGFHPGESGEWQRSTAAWYGPLSPRTFGISLSRESRGPGESLPDDTPTKQFDSWRSPGAPAAVTTDTDSRGEKKRDGRCDQ